MSDDAWNTADNPHDFELEWHTQRQNAEFCGTCEWCRKEVTTGDDRRCVDDSWWHNKCAEMCCRLLERAAIIFTSERVEDE